ncbi:MAG: protein kinase [Deltaproteobacteria bacterium]|nr:protein kinase [Deltaproteobacteria bacterium]
MGASDRLVPSLDVRSKGAPICGTRDAPGLSLGLGLGLGKFELIPFGAYDVLGRLATGGTANVFLARPRSGPRLRLVCLKTPLPFHANDRSFQQMFLDEARIALELRHPACVETLEAGEHRGTHFIVMEHIFGETLAEVIAACIKKNRVPPWPHVASAIALIADGLHHLHELTSPGGERYELVHRDVSPQNIMITFDGRPKLLDLGIVKARTGREPTTVGIVKGKFSYMSPEQISGEEVDRRSDLYSLGIVLFEALTARRLFRAITPEETAALILQGAPPLDEVAPALPRALHSICERALATDRRQRYATAAELALDLRALLASVAFPLGPSPLSELLTGLFRERIARRAAACALALAGDHDEARVLTELGASRAWELDLYPSPPSAEVSAEVDMSDLLAPLTSVMIPMLTPDFLEPITLAEQAPVDGAPAIEAVLLAVEQAVEDESFELDWVALAARTDSVTREVPEPPIPASILDGRPLLADARPLLADARPALAGATLEDPGASGIARELAPPREAVLERDTLPPDDDLQIPALRAAAMIDEAEIRSLRPSRTLVLALILFAIGLFVGFLAGRL